MRPRKKILLIDPDDNRRGEFKFILEVRGYRVVQTARGDADLIIARWPIAHSSCERLKRNNPRTPLLIIAPVAERMPLSVLADAVVWQSLPRWDLLDRIHVMCSRKRGPRKGYRMPPQPETQPAEVAATA
jgi:DNA-binding response OmpR family regulator